MKTLKMDKSKSVPGFGNPSCYARALGGCCRQMSGEHPLSRALLKHIDQELGEISNAVEVRNLAFQPRNVSQRLGIGSLESKILCKHHNETLDLYDAEALAAFKAFERLHYASAGLPVVIQSLYTVDADRLSGDDHGTERSFFDWSKAIRKVAPSIDITRIREVARAFRGQWRETYSLVELSRRALQLGDRELAASLAAEAVGCSSHFGWDRYSDGGSRLEAFECLVEIQPTTGREEAWKSFRDDFHSENYYRSRFVYNLDRLAKLLLGETPVRELYVEIEEHVRSLFDGAPLPEGGPELGLTGTFGQDNSESALFDFIEFHLVHPAPWVMQAAWRCVGHIVRQRTGAAERLIPRLLTSQEIVQESALPVIEAISAEDPALLAPFQDQISPPNPTSSARISSTA